MRILFVGGDKRNLFMLNYFKDKDVDVIGYDMVKGVRNKQIDEINISDYDIIIFPIDGVRFDYSITAKYNEDKIILPKNFLLGAKESTYVFSGIKSDNLDKMAKGLNYIKLLDYEDVKEDNGILTSEGIIANIIYNTKHSINNSNIVVLGYGKVAKPLVRALTALGANVKVGVIKKEDYQTLNNSFYTNVNMKEHLEKADVIINTSPNKVLDEDNLKYIKWGSYILDISSYPYGIDIEVARELNIDVTILSGIPGSISPSSAAKTLSKKIKSIVKES